VASSLGWVDFAQRDREDVLDLIRLLRKKETRDELGVGTVRDSLSDYFFPGTSTIQTRPRYFFFIPWTYHQVERKLARRGRRRPEQNSVRAVRDMVREYEGNLIQALLDGGHSDGVIGRTAGRGIERLPSSIYWAGLGRLRIRQWDQSRDGYHRWLAKRHGTAGAALVTTFLEMKKDEADETLVGDTREMWCRLPEVPDDFPQGVDLALTLEEASFLRERLAICAGGSLMDAMVRSGESDVDAPHLWDHPAVLETSEEVQQAATHAHNLSNTHHLAVLLYNLMLAECSERSDLVDVYRERIEDLGEVMEPRWSSIQSWCDRFEELWFHPALEPARRSASRAGRTSRFLKSWGRILSVTPRPADIVERSDARALIASREWELKRNRARLHNAAALGRWTGESGTTRLYFRWGTGRRFVADVRSALEREERA